MNIYACDGCGSRGVNMHKYTRICINMYECIIYMGSYIFIYIHTYSYIFMYIYVYSVYEYICVCMNMYAYVRKCVEYLHSVSCDSYVVC